MGVVRVSAKVAPLAVTVAHIGVDTPTPATAALSSML